MLRFVAFQQDCFNYFFSISFHCKTNRDAIEDASPLIKQSEHEPAITVILCIKASLINPKALLQNPLFYQAAILNSAKILLNSLCLNSKQLNWPSSLGEESLYLFNFQG